MASNHWTDSVPDLSGVFLERARDLATRRERLQKELDELHADNAALFADIKATGLWKKGELKSAFLALDLATVHRLPRGCAA